VGQCPEPRWRHCPSKSASTASATFRLVESQVVDRYELIQLGDAAIWSIRGALLEWVKIRSEGTQDQAKKAKRRIESLESERRKLIEMRLADAIPLELLKEQQDRITRQLADAHSDLGKTEVDWRIFEKNLNAALRFAANIGDGYAGADSLVRRQINQAVVKANFVDLEGVTGIELSEPMAQLMAEGLVDEIEAQIKRTLGIQLARGSSLNALVEVMRLCSNPSWAADQGLCAS
jgi:hypothetical protein